MVSLKNKYFKNKISLWVDALVDFKLTDNILRVNIESTEIIPKTE